MSATVQILLTVVLVAGGLLLYDALRPVPVLEPPAVLERSDPRGETAAADTPVVAQPTPEPFAVLQGTGEDLWRLAIDQRLAALEARLGSDRDTPAQGMGPAPTEGEPEASDSSPNASEPLTSGDLRQFRTLLEAVERQRRREQAAGKIHRYFQGLDLAMTDEQMRAAVRTTLSFQERWKRQARGPVPDEAAKRERREAYHALWGLYAERLRETIPAREADRILAALQDAGRRQE